MYAGTDGVVSFTNDVVLSASAVTLPATSHLQSTLLQVWFSCLKCLLWYHALNFFFFPFYTNFYGYLIYEAVNSEFASPFALRNFTLMVICVCTFFFWQDDAVTSELYQETLMGHDLLSDPTTDPQSTINLRDLEWRSNPFQILALL